MRRLAWTIAARADVVALCAKWCCSEFLVAMHSSLDGEKAMASTSPGSKISQICLSHRSVVPVRALEHCTR